MLRAARTYTNQGAGPTESNAADRHVIDLTGAVSCRIQAHVTTAGSGTGLLKLQYSSDGSSWADLTNTVALATTGLKQSTALALPGGAAGLRVVRVVAVSGNGTEDPVVGAVALRVDYA